MNQREFDFNKDVNEQTYKAEENLIIDEIVLAYSAKRNILKDETIILQLFFEEHCIEIVKRLKSVSFFNSEWKLEENSLGLYFFDFMNNKSLFNGSTLSEFITLILKKLDERITAIDLQKNSKSDFSFDRKISEAILENIKHCNLKNAVSLFIVYVKIWNLFKIYKEPFNNNKGLLIYRIFSERIWPKNEISIEAFSEFEKLVKHPLKNISNKNIYVPIFDNKESSYFSVNYLKERNKFTRNVEKLFEFDLTDESEPYHCLIEDILKQPLENAYKKNIIRSKVCKHMLPVQKDIEMFIKLYESSTEKEFGKWLLSRFYLYNFVNCKNKQNN